MRGIAAGGERVRLRVVHQIDARHGKPGACRQLADDAHEIGRRALVDLDLVAIGGGISRATPELFDHIRRGIDEHSRFEFTRKVRVVPSQLSDTGPLVGAAALVHRADLL